LQIQTLDLYCERLGPGLLAEPVNALTNLAFLLAAWAVWKSARDAQRLGPGVWLLIALMTAIGLGSGLFHTLATPRARLADELPILLFQLSYVWLYGRRVIGLGKGGALLLLVALLVLALGGRQFPDVLNGSLVYAAALAFIIGLGAYHFIAAKRHRTLLLSAAALLAVSIFLRTIDNAVCDAFPLGTHFLWHLLNAAVLYLAGRALLANLTVHRGHRYR
jgi:hypothetical protein